MSKLWEWLIPAFSLAVIVGFFLVALYFREESPPAPGIVGGLGLVIIIAYIIHLFKSKKK